MMERQQLVESKAPLVATGTPTKEENICVGAVKAARDQTELWIVAERRRAKDALMSIVEEEARRAAYREHEQQRIRSAS